MNPARSPQETATLPTEAQSARTVSATSSPVPTVETTSTSFITGAGLKKCMPMTSCGAGAWARAITGSEEVVARIAPGLQISSRFSNSAVFTERSSTVASTTMSTSARSSRRTLPVSRARTPSRAVSSSRPRWMAFSSDLAIVARTASTFSWLRPT